MSEPNSASDSVGLPKSLIIGLLRRQGPVSCRQHWTRVEWLTPTQPPQAEPADALHLTPPQKLPHSGTSRGHAPISTQIPPRGFACIILVHAKTRKAKESADLTQGALAWIFPQTLARWRGELCYLAGKNCLSGNKPVADIGATCNCSSWPNDLSALSYSPLPSRVTPVGGLEGIQILTPALMQGVGGRSAVAIVSGLFSGPLRKGSRMIYVARLIILLSVYTGSFLLAERTGYLMIAAVGGATAGVLEGLIQTGRIFVTPMPTSTLAKVSSAVPFIAAMIVVVANGISWPIVIAYVAPWFFGTVAVLTFDGYDRGV